MDKQNLDLAKQYFSGFSKLNFEERLDRLIELGALSTEDKKFLSDGCKMDLSLAEKFIENVIGYFQLPIGVATNFVIDKKAYAIPMAVEETSIIAAASKTAKWVRDSGRITTHIVGKEVIGQIQVAKVSDYAKFKKVILQEKNNFMDMVNRDVAHGLVRRGGGVTDIIVRAVERGDGQFMGVVHVLVDACDAMGANIVNQVCEYLKGPIQELTGETVTMCILSNLVDSKVTHARVEVDNIDMTLASKIVEASLFAKQDPYRAATNNKGVLNGIDPILIATGNDWRAVEAGVHAYAARSGQYRSVTSWNIEDDKLVGKFEAPLVLGIVGGVTKLHPMAQMSLRMLGVECAEELSKICASVGLIQNLGALKALTTEGIIEGHMKLHIKNLALGAGAKDSEAPILQERLEKVLKETKRVSPSQATEILKEMRLEV